MVHDHILRVSRPFVTARWSELLLVTFEAPEELVGVYVPSGLEPDRWDAKTHVTLVALQMLDIRVLGWRIPGFGAHPQVNFRTYVRCGAERAVTFIRELVPSRLVAAVARACSHEPFRAARVEARGVRAPCGRHW